MSKFKSVSSFILTQTLNLMGTKRLHLEITQKKLKYFFVVQ